MNALTDRFRPVAVYSLDGQAPTESSPPRSHAAWAWNAEPADRDQARRLTGPGFSCSCWMRPRRRRHRAISWNDSVLCEAAPAGFCHSFDQASAVITGGRQPGDHCLLTGARKLGFPPGVELVPCRIEWLWCSSPGSRHPNPFNVTIGVGLGDVERRAVHILVSHP